MKYRTYPKYKDSGVEWLGEIPEGWIIVPLKHLCNTITDGSHFSPETICDGYPYITVRDIESGRINTDDAAKISEEDFLRLTKDGCRPVSGDVLFSKDGTIGKVAIVDKENCVVLSSLAILRPAPLVESRYLLFLIRSLSGEKQIESHYRGSALKRITLEKIVQLIFCRPPLPTQRAIASFLDTETARIDGLIKDYEELIALLKEKRQALISHAVTRGLSELVRPDNPEFGEWAKPVKFKDSGVEWIGEIPEEWEVKKLSLCTSSIGDGLHGTPTYNDDGEYHFINGNNLVSGMITITDTTRRVSKMEAMSYQVGIVPGITLLLSINGTIGNIAIYAGESVVLSKSVGFMVCMNSLFVQYLSYYLRSFQIVEYYQRVLTGTTISNLSLESIRRMPTVLPQYVEQQAITTFLDKETARIDILIAEAESAIGLLKEHRSALITNAVTGKIDVEAYA